MLKKYVILLLLFVSFCVYSDDKLIAGNGDGKFLLILKGTVSNEEKVLYELKPGSYAALSDSGAFFSVCEQSESKEQFEAAGS